MPTDKTLYLFQKKEGYRYSSDSLVLYDFVAKLAPKGRVLDVGSGSGIVGLLIKRDFGDIALTQVDVQALHVELTQKSAKRSGLESEALHVDIREYVFDRKFDFVVTNPPFYHKGSQQSSDEVLRVSRYAEVLPFGELCGAVSSCVGPRGEFVFCYDAKQVDLLLSELLLAKFKVNTMRFVHTKRDRDASVVLVHAKKSSKSLCKILPPLYMDSSEMDEIYRAAQTQSIDC